MPMIESSLAVLALWGALGYLLGSIPGGVIMARLMGLGNLRNIGSGNIGATNVLRTGNKKAAALTLIFDAGKGAIAVLAARAAAPEDAVQLAALMAFIGHCFPVWLGFSGGKGVATYLGILLALAWPMGLAACGIWLAVAVITRYSSLAALVAAGWMPVVMAFTGYGAAAALAASLGLLIYARHWANIQRLRSGTEGKIGAK
ncbi:glycerol-3-phosphate 1-O-acyltransferase PlsY [Yoonia vestfoldensis]|uniref:Glycerol-3-phosphate acyltransferase n=1 Tax=Yoonia vestfoldensis TaxID=245188 RepID=A0A1Y0EFB2_9RHOB|nr:glycerol-3-phosphate 1-O-acyltransferase PlsY [Yoonia vestfoldensis]ARU02150.1 putative glycerol-3-phosphate acyltransferase [Yoonia vestfoldensis]